MASSSSRKACFQCENSNSVRFKNGWRLRSGQFAQLCDRCGSLYEEGRFCEMFHSNDDGWRDCEYCGKLVHCGCIASFHAYMLLDIGGVICMECSKINFIRARRRCLSSETQIGNGEPQGDAARDLHIDPQYCPRVSNLEKSLSASDADQKLARLVIPKKCAEPGHATTNSATAMRRVASSKMIEGFCVNFSSLENDASIHVMESKFLDEIHSMAFFPNISVPHGFPIKIQDTDGKEWEFQFRYWPNGSSKMYVLEGLKDYMILMQWQVGDIVTFYRIEPEGKLVMGLRKTLAGPPPDEISPQDRILQKPL